MPIQFRCGACQQLLGIARRKAGKVVACPTCGKKTLVPLSDPFEEAVTAPPPLPPIRRQVPKPVSIFDRVDVEKLLQPPRTPELVEERETATAVAEPPPRRQRPLADPLLDGGVDEPRLLEALAKPAEAKLKESKAAEAEPQPAEDEPFALMAQVPTLTPVRKSVTNLQLALYALASVVLALGAFFAGHWVGHHKPLF
jgi:DNA-directed RNA polymerase subunit RPC12/RpoP